MTLFTVCNPDSNPEQKPCLPIDTHPTRLEKTKRNRYFWARSILLTTPTIATVGLSLTIPVAYVLDIMVVHAPGSGSLLGAAGAMLTIVGFLFVNTSDETLKNVYAMCFHGKDHLAASGE